MLDDLSHIHAYSFLLLTWLWVRKIGMFSCAVSSGNRAVSCHFLCVLSDVVEYAHPWMHVYVLPSWCLPGVVLTKAVVIHIPNVDYLCQKS